MSPKRRRIKRRKRKKHVLLILLLIVAGIFLFWGELNRDNLSKRLFDIFKHEKIIPSRKTLPKISIVMDDLGPSKKAAKAVLNMRVPLTLSILPQEVYTVWIAKEGHRLGLEIIGHIPMEAIRPLRLGKGGLYTWMSDNEIVNTLDKNIRSIPYIIGISTHMGSAFTQDERAMHVLISELKKEGLLFLDSRTTPKSVAFEIAKSEGIKAFRRDVFLDDKDNPVEIQNQWKKLLKIARKKGYAIAHAHPRKNTIEFLQKTLRNNNEIKLVPLSELMNKP